MREIKFRIYDKELKETHIEELQDLCEDDIWYDGETEVWSVLEDCNNKQKRFVALQNTGLHDKNGKEIYEGDILKLTNGGEIRIGKVIYEYSGFTIDVINMNKPYGRVCFSMPKRYIEVIGNIYENPELLERKENEKRFKNIY